jgi:hypothetical protein
MKKMKLFIFLGLFIVLTFSSFSLKYSRFDTPYNTENKVAKDIKVKDDNLSSKLPVKPGSKVNSKVESKKTSKNKPIKTGKSNNDDRRIEGLGLAGFILGIVGWFTPYLGLVMCILAIVFCAISIGRINNNPDQYKGRGFATTGLILGIVGVALTLLLISALLVLL